MESKKSNLLRRNLVEVLLFSFFLFYLIYIRLKTGIYEYTGSYSDYYCYIEMSKDITIIFKHKIIQPFCYRIFIPLIVGLLPFDISINFALIGFISFYLTGIILYYTLRIHFNKLYSIIGFFMFWSITIPNFNFLITAFVLVYLVDLPGYLFLICSIYCILKDYRKLYGIFLIIGVLTKESSIFSIPIFILYNFINEKQKYNFRDSLNKFLKLFQYILPGIAIFILLHIIVKPDLISNHPEWYLLYEGNEYLTFGMIMKFINYRIDDLFNNFGIYGYTIGIWEVILLFIIFNKRKDLIKWVKIYGIFIILVYSQIFLAFATYRFILLAFYPIIFISVLGIENGVRKLESITIFK